MRAFLAFTAASLAILPAPALAEPSPTLAFRGGDGHAANHGKFRVWRDGDRPVRHRRGDAYPYYVDRDYQGDSAWRSTSFNDWWHEKTDRSYPRWMQNNAGCGRQWYAGDTLRC